MKMKIIWSTTVTANGSPITVELSQSRFGQMEIEIGDEDDYLTFGIDEISDIRNALAEAKYQADEAQRGGVSK